MNKKYIISIVLLTSIITFSGCDFFNNFAQSQPIVENGINDYNPQLHKAFIEKQFKENWYWLISSPEYDIQHMLNTASPNPSQPQYYGKLKIKVLHKEGKPVGFTSYYMLNAVKGDLFILGVDKEQRGKGYGSELVEHSEDALIALGAKIINFVTRVDNPRAQRMYLKLGFKELYRDDIFVHYKKDL